MHMYMLVWFMVFNATFNNISFISLRSVLLVEETGIPGENHRAVAIHWQTISYCCIAWVGFELTTLVGIGADCIDSCKSNYHTITTAPICMCLWGSSFKIFLKEGTETILNSQTRNIMDITIALVYLRMILQ